MKKYHDMPPVMPLEQPQSFVDMALEGLLSTFFPHTCHVCDITLATGSICSRCAPREVHQTAWPRCSVCFCEIIAPQGCSHERCNRCIYTPPPYAQHRYLFEYHEGLRHAIRKIKYHGDLHLAEALMARVAMVTRQRSPISDGTDQIEVIPPSLKGLMKRNFHLPRLLAEEIVRDALMQHLPIQQSLRHRWYSVPQASLKTAQRIQNMKNAWQVKNDVRGKHILLIDDIVTTGSTVTSAARALREAGALSVEVLSLTRSNHFDRFQKRRIS